MTEQHLDSNVPGNPAYHFTVLPPGTRPAAASTTRVGVGVSQMPWARFTPPTRSHSMDMDLMSACVTKSAR